MVEGGDEGGATTRGHARRQRRNDDDWSLTSSAGRPWSSEHGAGNAGEYG